MTAFVSVLFALFTGTTSVSAVPPNCTVPGDYATIQAAVNDVLCTTITVAAGTYAENVVINRTLTLNGANVGVAGTAVRVGESVIDGTTVGSTPITINAANVTIDGFKVTVTRPTSAVYGILINTAGANAVIQNNLLDTIITNDPDDDNSSTAQAIYLQSGPDSVDILNNKIINVQSFRTAKGVMVGANNAVDPATDVLVQGNTITGITSLGRGSYGVLVATSNPGHSNLFVKYNTINTLTGVFVKGIGLEGDTPNAQIDHNVISNLTLGIGGGAAVFFESNPSFNTVLVNRNSLDVGPAVAGIALHPAFQATVGALTANGECNWWGNVDGPGAVATGTGSLVGPSVDFTPWLTTTNLDAPCPSATLTLQKTVIKDNGGTALDTDWTLTATGPTTISGIEGAGAVTAAPVTPGVYTLSESILPAGYTASAWVCTGLQASTLVGDQLTLVSGENVTCTITNDDNAPATGAIEITKYLCPNGTTVTRALNGVGLAVPAGCVPDADETFGYVHGTQTDANAPYPELSVSPLTVGGQTNASGVLTISGLPATGRYLVAETDAGGIQLAASEILGLYCVGDGGDSSTNDNQELTFITSAGQTVKCVAYNEAAPAICGNSTIDFGEQCDDGNVANGDGCSMTCQREACTATDDLIAYWKLDESTGTTATDSTPFDNQGTYNDTPVPTTGVAPTSFVNPNALDFDGVDDSILVSDTTGIPAGGSARTIALWINQDTITDQQTLVSLGTGNTADQRFIFMMGTAGGNTYIFTDGINAANNISVSVAEIPTTGGWHHLAFILDGANNWEYYLDGTLVGSGAFSVPINTVVNDIEIGSRHDSATGFFDGKLDDVRIYNRVLSDTEINALFDGKCTPPVPQPTTGNITIIKEVVGGGPAVAADFIIHLTDADTHPTDYANAPGVSGSGTKYSGLHPDTYTISETGVFTANYKSVFTGDCATAGVIELAAGESKTCTITNTFVPPNLCDKEEIKQLKKDIKKLKKDFEKDVKELKKDYTKWVKKGRWGGYWYFDAKGYAKAYKELENEFKEDLHVLVDSLEEAEAECEGYDKYKWGKHHFANDLPFDKWKKHNHHKGKNEQHNGR